MYTNRKTAPLGWMKLYKFVILPLNIIVVTRNFLTFIGAGITFLNAVFIVFDLSLLALAVICEIGLIRWKRSGLICVYIIQWTGVIESIIVLFLSGFSGVHIAGIFVRIPLSVAWTTYFRNRALLFSPDYKDPEPDPTEEQVPTAENSAERP